MIIPMKGSPFGINDEATSVEMNILNDELPRCLDAVNGGSYTATAPISWNGFWTFAGAGNTVTFEAFALFDGASFNAVVTFNAAISVVAESEFLSAAVFDSGVSILGLLAVDSGAPAPTLGSGITVTGGVSTFGSGLLVTAGTAAFGSQVNVAAGFKCLAGSTPVVEAKLAINAGGHIKYRRLNGTASTPHTYAIADADVIIVQPGTLGGPTIYAISNAGCNGGERIKIQNNDGGLSSLQIRQENGVTGIATLLTSTKLIGVELMNNGSGSVSSAWEIIDYTTLP